MSFLKSLRNSRRHSGLSDISNVDKRANSTLIRISGRSKKKSSGILKTQQEGQPEQLEGLQRSDTFTIHDESGSSSKPHKTSVFEKFSTFTRKKKSPSKYDSESEVKPEGSYKRWPNPSDPTIVVEDPFDVLYTGQRPTSPNNIKKPAARPSVIDGGTYRKSKGSSQPRESVVDIKFDQSVKNYDEDNDQDKFRTVTINSYRKSFRKMFLSNTNEAPYNPSWFVEIEPPPKSKSVESGDQEEEDYKAKSNLLLFENENYRPTARSPVRQERVRSSENVSPRRNSAEYVTLNRSASSPVKRTDTFKVERDSSEPTFRIEIKNSITNEPGRMVPVGVAKPMPSSDAIVSSASPSPEKESQHLYRTRIQINGPSRNDGRRGGTFRSPVRSETRGRARQRVSPVRRSDPPLADYSPLKSYEMLSKLRSPTAPVHPDPIYVARVQTSRGDRNSTYARGRNTTSVQIQAYEQRSKSVSPNKQSHILLEQPVRKEAINMHRYSANIRKQQAKAPWR